MRPATPHPACFRRILTILLLAASAVWLSTPLRAAEGGRKLLEIEVARDRKSAEVVVPRGYGKVTLMRFDRGLGWRKVATRAVDAGVERFKLPSSSANTRWRAVGVFVAEPVQRKFPASFYKGRKSFDAEGASTVRGFNENFIASNSVSPAVDSSNTEPVEADIWKVDGGTVFFFNQLRGLQVLDVSNPADPRLRASLRLPAVGEDLYLLPGTGSTRDLVLVTRQESADGEAGTRIRVVRFDGRELTVRHRTDVPGHATDSRMVGDRLILATTEWGYSVAGGLNRGGRSRSRISQWTIRAGGEPLAGPKFDLPGGDPVISAGVDWLAAAVTPDGAWNRSDVTVFAIGKSGLTRMNGQPIRTAGSVRDKFKMQWKDHVLTTISERNGAAVDWRPVTVLQNFRVWGPDVVVAQVITDPLLGSLELAPGESLHGTRFAGDKAYVVTFFQTDPLWVVDLRDAEKPVVSGHIEVPGWSTYLQPVGDLLFSVGWESNTIAASLFDVADPAAPTLLRRINLGPPGSYSEAAWDEQALTLLPDAGLALIPVSHYDPADGTVRSAVQLLDVDLSNKELKTRGAIAHDFDARRSEIIAGAVVSISQNALVAADITDRDRPAILSEVALAWPVDEIIEAGRHLIHIESGASWNAGRATARITPADDTEAVLAEIDLGGGVVRDADLIDGRLYVVRDNGSSSFWFARPSLFAGANQGNKVYLDAYDASALPSLPRLGGSVTEVGNGYQVSASGLLWPRTQRPAVLLQRAYLHWFDFSLPIVTNLADVSTAAVSNASAKIAVIGTPSRVPQVLAFDVSDPESVAASVPVDIGAADTSLNGVAAASDGLIVAGASDNGRFWFRGLSPGNGFIRSMHVIEVGSAGAPVARPAIDIPGDLFAVSELDRNGFLVWTRNWAFGNEHAVTVSASDGYDAFEITSMPAGNLGAVAAYRRSLFVSRDRLVKRYDLSDAGRLDEGGSTRFPADIHSLRVRRGVIIGAAWNSVSAADIGAGQATTWRFPTWSMNVEGIRVARDGDILVPFGEYGAERLGR